MMPIRGIRTSGRCARGKRQGCCRAAEKREELAPPDAEHGFLRGDRSESDWGAVEPLPALDPKHSTIKGAGAAYHTAEFQPPLAPGLGLKWVICGGFPVLPGWSLCPLSDRQRRFLSAAHRTS